MISALRRLGRARKGSIITEFTFSMLLVLTVLLTTMEFGLEVFVRQSAERAVGVAAETYATTRSPSAARDAAKAEIIAPMNSCFQPLKITIFNNMTSLKSGSGRDAKGNSSDNGARVARVELDCQWTRLTPLPRMMLGARMNHKSVAFVRVR